jgi:large subunit ribosomal protein L21
VYAIIEDSGQQFRVCEGDLLNVDLRDLAEDAKELTFDRVLLVSGDGGVKVGAPLVAGAKVLAEIVEAKELGPKIHIYKMRRRKNYRRKTGHRQRYIQVRIAKIVA